MSTATGSGRPWAPGEAGGAGVQGTRAGAQAGPAAPGRAGEHGAPAGNEMLAVELAVGRMLRAGVALAAALVLAGLALLIPGLEPAWGRALATLGLAVLVLTPVARVVAALWVFVRERDVPYTVFCLVVLAALAAGVLLGKAE